MFETANDLETPVLIHTGLGQPFAYPVQVVIYAE
jgi:hypothetical protein